MKKRDDLSTCFLLADDHAIFRAGLRSILHFRYPDAELVEAGDGAAAIKCAEELKPDLIILDIHLPDQSGIEVARQMRTRVPSTRIIMMTAEPDLSYAKQAFKAGASAYLLKTSASDQLPAAVNAVLAGKPYVCPEASGAVLQDYCKILAAASIVRPVLSLREGEVLRAIAQGLHPREIAASLQIGVRSVQTYRVRLMKKLKVDSTAGIVRYALREGIVHP